MPSISSARIPASSSSARASASSARASARIFALCCALSGALAAAALPLAARADPIELKLSYFGTEHSLSHLGIIKPFVDAINNDGERLVDIKVNFCNALGRSQAQQPQLVLDGGADIALLVPGMTPYRFPDNDVLELAGLFHGPREATLVYDRLIAGKVLRGYDDFVVIGAYRPEPNVINSRNPIGSLTALKGQKIRVNNPMEAAALAEFGATPTVLEMPKIAQAIQVGAVDGTTLAPSGLSEFAIARVASCHYLLRSGTAPLVLVMSRKRFLGLPHEVQALIRIYSGNWTAVRWATAYKAAEKQSLAQLRADPQQPVVTPSAADLDAAQRVYQALGEVWAAKSTHNRELLGALRKELASVRLGD